MQSQNTQNHLRRVSVPASLSDELLANSLQKKHLNFDKCHEHSFGFEKHFSKVRRRVGIVSKSHGDS